MKTITYQLHLEQPLLATQLAGDPNSSVSFPYVPGGLLRGMLVQRYIEQHKIVPTDNLLADEACSALFFDGRVRYLHAYPLEADTLRRLLPTPRSLLQPKKAKLDTGLTIYDASHPTFTDERRREIEQDENDQLKSVKMPFCWPSTDGLKLYSLEPNRIATHVQRQRAKGRATGEQGTVFRYEALAEGQWFGGAIVADDDVDASELVKLLQHSEQTWLGRSRSANYGRVLIQQVRETSDWHELGRAAKLVSGPHARITLLSDTLLRDQHGQPTTLVTNELLEAYLGVPVALDPAHGVLATTQVGGYNRAWRLPLQQAIALKAGSVIAFAPTSPLSAAAVAKLEREGLGERRVEGFGRVVFDWQLEEELVVQIGDLHTKSPHSRPETLSGASSKLAQRMAKRLFDEQINALIQIFLRDKLIDHPDNLTQLQPLKNSQLGRIRVLVRRALNTSTPDPGLVRNGLGSFKPVARAQLEGARFGRMSFAQWLERLLDTSESGSRAVWAELGWSEANAPRVAGVAASTNESAADEASLRLIEAVCVAISRQRRRDEQNQEVAA